MDQINVLIIEDTPAQSDALSKVLVANNYNVVGIAPTYTEALDLFYKNKFSSAQKEFEKYIKANPKNSLNYSEVLDFLQQLKSQS